MRIGLALAIILFLIALAHRPMAAGTDGVRLMHAFTWDTSTTEVGGLSAILMDTSGTRALALGDRGSLFDLLIRRGEEGIESVRVQRTLVLPISAAEGRLRIDSEGIARASDTDVFVSFERVSRIARLNTQSGAMDDIHIPPSFRNMAKNRGLEALAIDDQGNLFTLAERPGPGFAVWRRGATGWDQPFSLKARDGFLAASAEFGPDGRFYLLERKITILGFQSRLRRWDIAGDTALNETTLLTTRAGQFGNLEGLSFWWDNNGALRATMVSDDNFLRVMRTQLVEYVVTE